MPSSRSEADEKADAFRFPQGLDLQGDRRFSRDWLCGYSSVDLPEAEAEALVRRIPDGLVGPEDRALGCMIGNAVGDALGAPLEFSPVRYGSTEVTAAGLEQAELWTKPGYNVAGLAPGQWTDDFSMALCLAESLLVHGGLEPRDLRLRFLNWWTRGYCNAFARDPDRPNRSSIGLGGNISESLHEFLQARTDFTAAGDERTSGNGSIMRLSPVPVRYWRSPEEAMRVARDQSRTTHQGIEAAECCRLLAFLCARAIGEGGGKSVLDRLDSFRTPSYGVQCLAAALQEERHPDNVGSEPEDRDWRWTRREHRYAPGRAARMPGYVGSYCMDALAMALHCVHSTGSFVEALLKSANLRGDSDSVGAVTGQIAGAIYGIRAIPAGWIRVLHRWDGGRSAALAHRLFSAKE